MDPTSGTFSGASLEAALAKAAAELHVPATDIEHETLLGSDASGHVLIRARARLAEPAVAAFARALLAALSCPATLKCVALPDALQLQIVGSEAAAALSAAPHAVSSLATIVVKAAEKLDPGRRVVVDVLEEEEDRDALLARMAEMAIARCRRYGRPVALPPMSAYERRMLHLAVREHSELSTESTGDGRDRRLVVIPYEEGAVGPAPDSSPAPEP